MELNLFSFIIYSINILTIMTNFVYSSALSIDKEVKQANLTVKWNITEVKEPDLEEQEKEDEGDYGKIKVKVPKDKGIATSDDKDTDKFPGVPLSILAQLPEIDSCMPSRECPQGHWPWCEVVNGTVRCICILEYYRSRPICKPTCTVDSECDADMWCIHSRCRHPCPGYCGTNIQCDVINHIPHCSCPPGFVGNPHISCNHMHKESIRVLTWCKSKPCGPYSQCKEDNGIAVCKCLPNTVGPDCIRTCTNNSECNELRACINNRCSDICPACGNDAQCHVHNHIPYCSCLSSPVRYGPDLNCQIIHEAMDPTFGYKQYPIMGPKFDPTKESLFGLITERDFVEWKKKNRWPYNIPPPPRNANVHPSAALVASGCPSDSSRINGKCVRTDE